MKKRHANPGPEESGAKTLTLAVKIISIRARSTRELEEKLKRKGRPEEEIKEAVARLTRDGYLNDSTFAKLLASSRVKNKNWGKIKIAAELRDKGVERGIIAETLGEFNEDTEKDSLKKALKKWMKKNSLALPLEGRVKIKAVRHLNSRGFSLSLIHCVLRGAGTEDFTGEDEFYDDLE